VTVPLTLDHNRIVIDVDLLLPNGSTQRIAAWVDNGNPDLYMSRRIATLLGLNVSCAEQACTALPPQEIFIGGMKIPLATAPAVVKEAKIPQQPGGTAWGIGPGLSAEINLPAAVLRNYDVLIDFPESKFTIAQPGRLKFNGVEAKAIVNPTNGLIQIPSQIEKQKYNLALDLGSCISFLSEELFEKLAAAHADWPHMTGAIGSANMWGMDTETKWKLVRVARVQFGPLFLTDVAVTESPKDRTVLFEKPAGAPTAGLIGSQALLNYRVGFDYARSTVYFDIGRLFSFPDFDVIGLILRPEDDGRYTILSIADYDGKPSVAGIQTGDHLVAVDGIPVPGSTMGQVWRMLGGTPCQERKLTIERAGKQVVVTATVQHFLAEADDRARGKARQQ